MKKINWNAEINNLKDLNEKRSEHRTGSATVHVDANMEWQYILLAYLIWFDLMNNITSTIHRLLKGEMGNVKKEIIVTWSADVELITHSYDSWFPWLGIIIIRFIFV